MCPSDYPIGPFVVAFVHRQSVRVASASGRTADWDYLDVAMTHATLSTRSVGEVKPFRPVFETLNTRISVLVA